MRALELLSAAAQAESLRVRRGAAGTARGAVLNGVAGLFGLTALAMLHVSGWLALAEEYGAIRASLGVGAADVVLMGLMLLIGRKRRDPVADAALLIRQRALNELRETPLMGNAFSLLGSRLPVALMGGAVAEGLVRAFTRR